MIKLTKPVIHSGFQWCFIPKVEIHHKLRYLSRADPVRPKRSMVTNARRLEIANDDCHRNRSLGVLPEARI
ncbi:hypothetical protein EVAR_82649_1 [Eumeta japonica]|uniref:Uncharacterized protein n=1 Tax=Eumeta variegata TaxID=151549 RepID=A0A4C1VDL5_EUMVA|nr:hypothetical protein EVAR_82649_1 [Eumeta japonica]